MSSRHLFAVLASAASIASLARAQPAPSSATPTPRLVVFFTVDQLLPTYFEKYGRQLTGGLGRLYRNGAVFTNAFQDHAITETAPGHASVLSGRFPRGTGIVTNSLGVVDVQTPLVGVQGPGASPYRFRGSTLIDWMRLTDARSRALSVSRKDRGAILPLGRAKQHVYWYAGGRFTTSTYYADTLPTWVQRFNARQPSQAFAGRVWTPLLPDREYAEPDSVPFENTPVCIGANPPRGLEVVFPHGMPRDGNDAARLLPYYPWMDEHTLALALEGVQALDLGRGPQPDLLAVSLSTTDQVGHQFGPDSKEIHDMVLRLDRYMGAFLDSLYRLRDSTTIAVALTADHGVAAYPEVYAQRHRMRVQRADIRPAVSPVLAAAYAAGIDTAAFRLELEVEVALLWVDRDAFHRRGLDADSAIRAVAQAVRRVPGVQRADEVRALRARDPARLGSDYVARRWLQMLPADLRVELVVTLEPQVYWSYMICAMHGSPHDYDTHVPLIFYGPWFAPGRYTNTVRVVDMAPTLAQVLNVRPTEELDGRVLAQALRRR